MFEETSPLLHDASILVVISDLRVQFLRIREIIYHSSTRLEIFLVVARFIRICDNGDMQPAIYCGAGFGVPRGVARSWGLSFAHNRPFDSGQGRYGNRGGAKTYLY